MGTFWDHAKSVTLYIMISQKLCKLENYNNFCSRLIGNYICFVEKILSEHIINDFNIYLPFQKCPEYVVHLGGNRGKKIFRSRRLGVFSYQGQQYIKYF